MEKMFSNAFSVERHESEWETMWNGLFLLFDDFVSPCGEGWQYMGTWMIDGLWNHQFRHRCYKDGQRRLVNILPTPSYLDKIPQVMGKVA